MSEFIDNAEALEAKIKSIPECAGVAVIVDRQKDISNEIEIAVAGTTGASIDILWLGGVPFDLNADANLTCRYRVSVRTTPILRQPTQIKADMLCKHLVKELWQWDSTDEDDSCSEVWSVLDVDLVPDEQHLVYQIILEVKTEIL